MSRKYSIEALERYRVLAAYLILKFGDEYGFVLERVESDLERARQDDPQAKALKVMDELQRKRDDAKPVLRNLPCRSDRRD
ncbi:conserved protein of unknown function [Hyphomicrobium sp. 1Nfss2.1]|uniref:hypothetical protein n=1 Tax=Hyphomicrobium sp. 1Nfss2.1 TaxID=3413936 RepID=UPI003C7D9896